MATRELHRSTRPGYNGENLAYTVLADVDFTPETRAQWELARYELDQAVLANDLSVQLDRYYAAENMMGGHVAYQGLRSYIEHLEPERAKMMSKDAIDGINAAFDNYRDRFRRELDNTTTRNLAYVPAPFRTPLQEARRGVSGLLAQADDLWGKDGTDKQRAENRDVALVLEDMAQFAPTSFGMYARSGAAIPTHLIGGDGSAAAGATRVPLNPKASKEVNLAQPRALSGRKTALRVPMLRQYGNIEAAEMTRIATRQGVMAIATNPGLSKAAAELPSVVDEVADWHANHAPTEKMPAYVFKKILAKYGWAVVKGATEDSVVSTRGDMNPIEFNQPARFDKMVPDGERSSVVAVTDPVTGNPIIVEWENVDTMNGLPDIRVVPDYLADVLNDVMDPKSGKWLTMYDQITQLWKTATLAWSVAWVTYNAIGNALMASFSYGQSPSSMLNNMSTIRNELRRANEKAGYGSKAPLRTAMRNDTLSNLVPSRMGAHGPSWAEKESVMQLSEADTRLGRTLDYVSEADRSVLGRLTTFSYTLNEFTDNMFRSSVMLDDLHRRLGKEAKVPRELLTKNGRLRTDLSPDEHAQFTAISKAANDAQDASVRAALNTMGDFTRLTPMERKLVKRIFPFYPWMRHQTAMTFRMPLQNPLRWAWAQSLATMLADDDDGDAMAHLLSGMAITSLGSISLTPANPFSGGLTAFGSDDSGTPSLFSKQGLLRAANPIAKLPVQLATGVDTNQGEGTSRPMDQKSTNSFGQLVGTSAAERVFTGDVLGGLGEAGYQALGLAPQTRGLRDMALGSEARYDSGDAIPYADNRPGGLLAQIARTARVPFVPSDQARRLEEAEKRDAQTAREARRYSLRQATRAGGG